MLVLSFTDIPYNAYHALGNPKNDTTEIAPKNIVLMGGDGMPAPNALIRLYYTAEVAKKFPNAKIIIAHPMNQNNNYKQLELMSRELVLKGIDSSRIIFEPNGFNTRSQALEISRILKGEKKMELLIVTSPEHIFRTSKCFEKLGFYNVRGLPTFEKPSDEESLTDKKSKKKKKLKNLAFRYNMWSYLNYEILILREYAAISYYWLKGWI